jgi:hypothetical protein
MKGGITLPADPQEVKIADAAGGSAGGHAGPTSPTPNTRNNSFNPSTPSPAPGTFQGLNPPPDSTPPNAAPGLTGTDYDNWLWEEVLNGVLGTTLPPRTTVIDGPWTLRVSNTKGDGSMLEIWKATWGDNKDFIVYLNPDVQDPNGAWISWLSGMSTDLVQASSGNYTNVAVDPRTFGSAAVAVAAVEQMIWGVAEAFGQLSSNLSGEDSQFKGDAGAAFYQIINNLYTATNGMSETMGTPVSTSDYANQILQAGEALLRFVGTLLMSYENWGDYTPYSPLGAILTTLQQHAVQLNGTWTIPDPLHSPWGDLTDNVAWGRVEQDAKGLWLNTISAMLDPNAAQAVQTLAQSYYSTASSVQPIPSPVLAPVIAPSTNLNVGGGLNNGGIDLNPIGDGLAQMGAGISSALNALQQELDQMTSQMANSLNNESGGLGDALKNIGGGLNNVDSGLGLGLNNLGDGLKNIGGGLNNVDSGLGLGLNNLGGGLGGALKNIGGGLNNVDSGLGLGLNNLGGGLKNIDGGLNNVDSGLGLGLNNLGGGLKNIDGGLNNVDSGLGLGLNNIDNGLGQVGSGLGTGLGAVNKSLAGEGNNLLPSSNSLANEAPLSTSPGSVLSQALASPPNSSVLSQAVNSPPNSSVLSNAVHNPSGNSLLDQTLASPPTNSVLNQALASPPSSNLLSQALQNPANNSPLSQALASPPNNSLLGQALANPNGNSVLDQALRNPGGNSLLEQALRQPGTNSQLDQALLSPANNTALDRALLSPPNSTALDRALLSPPNSSALDQSLLSSTRVPLPGGSSVLQTPSTVGTPELLNRLNQGPLFSSVLPASTGAAAPPVSSGRFVAPAEAAQAAQETGTSSSGLGGVPFYPPMYGGGMGMGGGMGTGGQERERTTWLAEDEEVWGTDPAVGVGVLGRDVIDDEEEDTFGEPAEERGARTRSGQSRRGRF